MYTLNSTSVRRAQQQQQQQQQQQEQREPLTSSPSLDAGGANVPFVVEPLGHGSPATNGVPSSLNPGEALLFAQATRIVTAGAVPGPVSGGQEAARPPRSSLQQQQQQQQQQQRGMPPKMSLQQQRMQEELYQEKLRVQQEIAQQQQRLQQQSSLQLAQKQRNTELLPHQPVQQQQMSIQPEAKQKNIDRQTPQLTRREQHLAQPFPAQDGLMHFVQKQGVQQGLLQQLAQQQRAFLQRGNAQEYFDKPRPLLVQQQEPRAQEGVLHLSYQQGSREGILQQLAQQQEVFFQRGNTQQQNDSQVQQQVQQQQQQQLIQRGVLSLPQQQGSQGAHKQLAQQRHTMRQGGNHPQPGRYLEQVPQQQQQQHGIQQMVQEQQAMPSQGAQRWRQRNPRQEKQGRMRGSRNRVDFGHRGDSTGGKSTGVRETPCIEENENSAPIIRDEQFVQKLKDLYALQADDAGKTEHLREQASTALGVVGTLDVERCSRLIAEHDVTIVVTDTGTGKSTLIPKAILDGHPDAKIANAQPRRTPAIKLAQRVAALCGEKVGDKVGYWVRGEHVGTVGETPIMYVTNYTLFLHLLHYSPEDIDLTHVIFDEFHERTVEVEVLLLMMKLVMERNPGKLKLVLCSATAEVSKWACFFENMTVAEYSKANAMYPIHDYYLEDVCKLIGVSFVEPKMSPTGVVQSVQLHAIIMYIKEMLKFLAATAVPEHSILVFVPGRTVVEQLSKWIRDNLGDQLDPIPWYRDIELSFIQEALQRESVTRKKVYVATDIAEVSLTLPDVVFVIDSGTAKRPHIIETSPNSVAFPPLELVWESSVNLMQRRGRIGRVQQGFFFTMLSREQSQALSPSESRLGNAVLHEIVLHCLHLTPSPFLMFSMCREEPRQVSVRLSISTLCDGGYIVPEGDQSSLVERIDNAMHLRVKTAWNLLIEEAHKRRQGGNKTLDVPLTQLRFNVTLRGLIVGGLPFGVEPGTIVFHGLITGLTTLAIIAAACVSCNTPFYVPYNVTDKLARLQLLDRVEKLMRGFKGEYHNDALAAVGAVLAYMAMQRDGLSEEGQNAWCEERFLSRSRIADILLVVRQTKEQLAAILPYEDVTDVEELMEQYNGNALPLSLICSSAHMHHGIYVLYDAQMAEKKRYAGSGVFVNINCCRDKSVPTTCLWARDTVCIPFTVQTIYGRLVGSFSSQLRPEVFNVMLLLFSSRFTYGEIGENTQAVLFEVSQSGSSVYISCDRTTALQLLQIRRLICARLCVLHLLMQREVGPNDADAIAEHLRGRESDFGIPPNLEQHPELLPAMITSAVTKVVKRIEAAADARKDTRGAQSAFEEPQPFCRAAEPPAEFRPARQSVLVFSSNGCAPYECPSATRVTPIYRDPNASPRA